MGTIDVHMEHWEASPDNSFENQFVDGAAYDAREMVQLREELLFFKTRIKNLESELRNAEDKNGELYREIKRLQTQIRFQNEQINRLKDAEEAGKENTLHNTSTEDAYVRLKAKYKKVKSDRKEMKRELKNFGFSWKDTESEYSFTYSDEQISKSDTRFDELERKLVKQKEITKHLQGENYKKSQVVLQQNATIDDLESERTKLARELEDKSSLLEQSVNINEVEAIRVELENSSKENLETNALLEEQTQFIDKLYKECKELFGDFKLDQQSFSQGNNNLQEIKKQTILSFFNNKRKSSLSNNGFVYLDDDKDNNNEPTSRPDCSACSESSFSLMEDQKDDPEKPVNFTENVDKYPTSTLNRPFSSQLRKSVSMHDGSRDHELIKKLQLTRKPISQQTQSGPRRMKIMVNGSEEDNESENIKRGIIQSLAQDTHPETFAAFPYMNIQLTELKKGGDIKEYNQEDLHGIVERMFALLTLALRSDRLSLGTRLGGQRENRDNLETRIETDLREYKTVFFETFKKIKEPEGEAGENAKEKREGVRRQLMVLVQSVQRLSSASASLGALQLEAGTGLAVETVTRHVELLRRGYEKEHREMAELKDLLKEYHLSDHEESLVLSNDVFEESFYEAEDDSNILNPEYITEEDSIDEDHHLNNDERDEADNSDSFEVYGIETTYLQVFTNMEWILAKWRFILPALLLLGAICTFVMSKLS